MPRIGNVSALLSVNTSEFTAGLNYASNQLSKFGRSVSAAFGEMLPASSFSAAELELMRFPEQAKAAEQALKFPAARESIQALHGGLVLLTGQTGFFVVEAARAASHVSNLVKETGGLGAAVIALGGSFGTMLATLGPLGAALLGIGSAYAAIAYFANKADEAQKEANKTATESTPIYDSELKAIHALKLATGEYNEFTVRRLELEHELGRTLNPAESTSLQNTVNAEEELKSVEKTKRHKAELLDASIRAINDEFKAREELRQQLANSEEAFRKEQIDREWEFEKDKVRIAAEEAKEKQDIADRLLKEQQQAAQDALISSGSAKRADFINDPFLKVLANFNDRIDALKNDPGKIGADFAISSTSFRGNAPVGDVFGQQKEQSKANEHLAEIEELNRELVSFVKANGFGVTID